ncbi:hypothetical protein Mal64_13950 [Pseudobythopirellula maris]|uniref:Uncharacterized protein n=1 Tax=Pseudobythopirellula maris TaxID=2527991 RepID=A0A5C5ZUU3_9BACT|nr:hypothetical protein [Pseudobythopirellula maris]TWT90996.1 hypothetical protein Mal64_13950 [Pseudobythopirellula maris]
MQHARDAAGTLFESSGAVLLARVVRADGALLTPAQVSAVSYSVSEVDACRPHQLTPVEGHANNPLTPGDVFFAALQTDGYWEADESGYNFRHEVDVSSAEAFPAAGRAYLVRYEVTPVSGQKIVFRFRIKAI